MALTTAPTEVVDWAKNIINNSPSGGPNRAPYDARFSNSGWLFGEKPPYETMNQWQFGISEWKDWLEVNLIALDADTSAAVGDLDTRVTTLEDTPVPASIKIYNSGYTAVSNGVLYNFDHLQNTKNMMWTVYGATSATGDNELVVHDQEWTEDHFLAQGYMIKVDTLNRINFITAEAGYLVLSDIGKGGSPQPSSSQRRNWQYVRIVGIGF